MAKDVYVFILIALWLDMASSLQLSQESMTRKVGDVFIVICKDHNGLSVTWKGPKGNLNANTRPSVILASYGTAIVFNNTRLEDAGNYTCVLSKHPHERKIFSLNIEEDLKFINTPKTQVGKEGKDFIIKCQVNLPGVEKTWLLKSGKNLDKRYQVIPEGLYISNLSREDAQEFICQAVHMKNGNIFTRNIMLIVQHKPVLPYSVFAEEDEVYAFLGESVNLTCEVEANPPPKFTWEHRKMGKVINVSSHISVLELPVNEKTPGTYECIAFNTLGQLHKFFEVQLGERPDPPTNIELINSKPDLLELKIEVPEVPLELEDPVMDPQWIVVEYKPVSEEEWRSTEFNITSESIVLSDLSKSTKYEIRAATRNIAGLSEFYFNETTLFETSPATSVHIKPPVVLVSAVVLVSLISIT